MAAEINYDYLLSLRRNNPAWRLLAADSAPLVISFLYGAFIEPNIREMSEVDLIEKLEDALYRLRELNGEEGFGRTAHDYVREWSEPEKGWLRRFYREDGDEPYIDLTPSVEKAIAWVKSLEQSAFVGTESRLKIIFELLRQITEETDEDRGARIKALEKRRDEIDAEIERIKGGGEYILDDTAVRDRFQQFAVMARDLLSDFREVEFNFRALDRDIRKRITISTAGKGEILDDILGRSDHIEESDQGRSFRAFMEFLLSPSRQEELNSMLEKIFEMRAIAENGYDRRLMRIPDAWLDASDHAIATMRMVSAQLRQFLNGRVWLENRRVTELIQNIIRAAAQQPPGISCVYTEIDEPGVDIELPMERPMFVPLEKRLVQSHGIELAEGGEDDGVLFDLFYIDTELLAQNIYEALEGRTQASLGEIVSMFPITRGLAEIVSYMDIAAVSPDAFFDKETKEYISWTSESGAEKRAVLPRIIFTKKSDGEGGSI